MTKNKDNAQGGTDIEQKTVKIVRRHSDDPLVYYANDSIVTHSKWDVQLNFGQLLVPFISNIAEAPDDYEIPQELVVMMSLKHAKAFSRALVEHLDKVAKEEEIETSETD